MVKFAPQKIVKYFSLFINTFVHEDLIPGILNQISFKSENLRFWQGPGKDCFLLGIAFGSKDDNIVVTIFTCLALIYLEGWQGGRGWNSVCWSDNIISSVAE